jgi:hypothetical protein
LLEYCTYTHNLFCCFENARHFLIYSFCSPIVFEWHLQLEGNGKQEILPPKHHWETHICLDWSLSFIIGGKRPPYVWRYADRTSSNAWSDCGRTRFIISCKLQFPFASYPYCIYIILATDSLLSPFPPPLLSILLASTLLRSTNKDTLYYIGRAVRGKT